MVPLFPFYFAYKKWQDSFVFKSYLVPAALIMWWCACSFYNLRMFYRVPHRSPIYIPINNIEPTNRTTSSIKSIFSGCTTVTKAAPTKLSLIKCFPGRRNWSCPSVQMRYPMWTLTRVVGRWLFLAISISHKSFPL